MPRLRAALAAAGVLLAATPWVSHALAPHLTCGVQQTGRWERIPVPAFQPVSGISASQDDAVSSYTVDETAPQDVAATNGTTVLVSRTNGCDWTKALELALAPTASQPFSGATAGIVSVALLGSRALVAVQEGSGTASRPHVLVGSLGGGFGTSDSGLPPQGAPRLLRAAGDGRTAYLTVSPTATGGTDGGSAGGLLPVGVPTAPTGTPTGLLYRTVDAGASWQLQTGAADLPGGGTGLTALDLDPADSNTLYGLVGGDVVVSHDGGASFTKALSGGFTALTAMGPSQVVAFSGAKGWFSGTAGRAFASFPAPAGVTSAAFRPDSGSLVVESSGALRTLNLQGSGAPVPAAAPARTGSLLGDRGSQASVHALSGHSLLRLVDPVPTGPGGYPPLAAGDLTIAPPLPGTVSPAVRSVRLPVGSSAVEDFTLDLPRNPTPLDLYFLVDVSSGMQPAIDDVKANLNRIVTSLTSRHVDLKVGVGILGSGPAKNEADFPPTGAYAYPPVVDPGDPTKSHPDPRTYRKPVLYKRIRAIGAPDANLRAAIDSLTLETIPSGGPSGVTPQSHEGQLIALKNAATGDGTRTREEAATRSPFITAVPPGQDAGFRGSLDVRRIILLVTNENFDDPAGTDDYPDSDPVNGNPHINFGPTLQVLREKRIQVLGLTAGGDLAAHDLQTLARGTGALAPAGGVECGGDPPVTIPAGQPLVCGNADGFSTAIQKLLASLVDRQTVTVVPTNRTPVLGALDGRALVGLDVKRPSRAEFSVRVSCAGVHPGRWSQGVSAVLRRTVVGRARVDVTCVAAAAAVKPRPVTVGNPPPPPAQPLANVVAPVAPAPPVAQPQVQPQTQVQTQVQAQVQPMTGAALEQQQQLQLALALNGPGAQEEGGFTAGTQLAMVDRRRQQEVQALGVLAFALTACAGVGLARLRTRPEPQVRRAR